MGFYLVASVLVFFAECRLERAFHWAVGAYMGQLLALPWRTALPATAALFVGFFLASSALINLGEAPDPMSGERQVDLDQAKEAIDLLRLLREKTEGNRTEHESRLLEQILYDVQMRFVQATERNARA